MGLNQPASLVCALNQHRTNRKIPYSPSLDRYFFHTDAELAKAGSINNDSATFWRHEPLCVRICRLALHGATA